MAQDRDFDPRRVTVPWSAIGHRDMTVSDTAGPQFLVGDKTVTAADTLRPWSVTLSAGVTVVEGLRENMRFPRTAGDVTGSWLVEGGGGVTAADPTLTTTPATPHSWAGVVEFSHSFIRASEQAEAFIRRELLRVAGRAVDAAVPAGSGVSGQPTGVVKVPGVRAIAGGSLGNADILNMHELVTTSALRALLGTGLAEPLRGEREDEQEQTS